MAPTGMYERTHAQTDGQPDNNASGPIWTGECIKITIKASKFSWFRRQTHGHDRCITFPTVGENLPSRLAMILVHALCVAVALSSAYSTDDPT